MIEVSIARVLIGAVLILVVAPFTIIVLGMAILRYYYNRAMEVEGGE